MELRAELEIGTEVVGVYAFLFYFIGAYLG